jgi:nucleoside-diphosphate-sugar epimerase
VAVYEEQSILQSQLQVLQGDVVAKILVTGGAGYLGSILVPKLLQDGHDVTVIDSFMYRQHSLLELCSRKDFDIIRGDVRDARIMHREIAKADVIIPLAALVGMPACRSNPVMARQVNFDAIKFICDIKSPDQLLLYPNTNSGYGQGEGSKFTEKSVLNPVSVYGTTKVEAEKAVLDVKNSMAWRLATVFGVSPRMRLDLLVNDFTYRAWYDRYLVLFESQFIRNYIHIRDVADGFAWALRNWDKVKGEVFNLGLSDCNLSKMDLAQAIKKVLPDLHIAEAPLSMDPDKRNYIVVNDKIESRGFTATRPLELGIRELIKSFQIIQPQTYSNETRGSTNSSTT